MPASEESKNRGVTVNLMATPKEGGSLPLGTLGIPGAFDYSFLVSDNSGRVGRLCVAVERDETIESGEEGQFLWRALSVNIGVYLAMLLALEDRPEGIPGKAPRA